MACRHEDPVNNPGCSSYRTPEQQLAQKKKQIEEIKQKFSLTDSPDNSNYEVDRVQAVGNYLVMRVTYPNCAKCAYEGNKVMVFEGVGMVDAIRWRQIDPHFRPLDATRPRTEAPSPIARFPANDKGWSDALRFAGERDRPFNR